MDTETKTNFHDVYRELRTSGACKLCSYRFLCNSELKNFTEEFLESEGYEVAATDDVKLKKNKSNTCVICLSLFEDEVVEEAKKQVVNEVQKCGYDCTTYMLALVLPISCSLREHCTFLFLKSKFPELYKECPYSPRLGLKESWRYLYGPAISKVLNKTLDVKSEMSIQVEFTYSGDWKDCLPMSHVVRVQPSRPKLGVICCMKLMNEPDFAKLFPFPMCVPNDKVNINTVTIKRDSIFVAGRYNKYSRELSQTPWILPDGERKMELSVEEIISNKIKEMMEASDSRFSSSGREDVDVRTLGNGRPFAVELLSPRISQVSEKDIRNVEKQINLLGAKLIFIRDLQIVCRSDMTILKNGEECKTKEYCCACIVKRKLSMDYIRGKMPSTPFIVQQKTPIRVLHRRPVATREKTIHTLIVEEADVESPEGCTVFKLNLRTQAGTYVKELVHGDFGRTQPNISTLLDNVAVDVLELDVTNVAVDWPPPVNYEPEPKKSVS